MAAFVLRTQSHPVWMNELTMRPGGGGRIYLFVSTLPVTCVVLLPLAALITARLVPAAFVVALILAAVTTGRVRVSADPGALVIVNRLRSYRVDARDVRLTREPVEVGLGQLSTVAIEPPAGASRISQALGRVPIEATVGLRADALNRTTDAIVEWQRRSR
jgi:hypothetical protein